MGFGTKLSEAVQTTEMYWSGLEWGKAAGWDSLYEGKRIGPLR